MSRRSVLHPHLRSGKLESAFGELGILESRESVEVTDLFLRSGGILEAAEESVVFGDPPQAATMATMAGASSGSSGMPPSHEVPGATASTDAHSRIGATMPSEASICDAQRPDTFGVVRAHAPIRAARTPVRRAPRV